MKKNEIDLNLVPHSGEEFTYDAEDLSKLSDLEESVHFDEKNSVALKIRPIEGTHFQLDVKYSVKSKRQCSRCGTEFVKDLTDKDHKDYLSTSLKEGEDEGFVLVEDPKRWNWAEYFRQTVELEVPFQDLCKEDCRPNDDRVILEGDKKINSSPFEKLKDIKVVKKH